MAHAFTPGLRVAKQCIVRRERILPLKGEVLVRVGDAVRAADIVARTELPGDIEILNAAFEIGCDPQDLPSRMLKAEGDAVAQGEVLARSKSFFGLFTNEVKSPCAGTVETISGVTGKVLLRRPPQPVEVAAYISGIVDEVREAEGVVVETPAAIVQGIIGVGGETHGEIHILTHDPDEVLEEDAVDESCAGKVVVGGKLVTLATLQKCVNVGVSAVVTGGINDVDLEAFLGYALGVAITGHEELGLTLVVTEGFGEIRMAARTFELLASHEGRSASVNGATQIRAGVIRPEVVIPLDGSAQAEETADGTMRIGDTVRIIREPYFGHLATVAALPQELTQIETEAAVRALAVRLDDGSVVTLPRANVEVIVT